MKKSFLFLILFLGKVFSQTLIDGVVAVVGNTPILLSEVDQIALMTAAQLRINYLKDTTKFKELRRTALSALIDEYVLLEVAKIETIEVKDREVEATLNQQIENMIAQVGSQEEVENILGMPLNKVKRVYRPLIKNRLIIEKLKNEKFKKLSVTRKEVEKFYEIYKDSIPEIPPSYDFSNILIKIKPGPLEEQRARLIADSILTLLRNGEDFAKLARENSDDEASAKYGGDLGYIKRGSFVKSFEEVAFSLQPGEISDIVKTEFGFHIIEMIDKKGELINVRHILIKPITSDENFEYYKAFADSIRNLIVTNKISFDSAVVKFSDEPNKEVTKGRVRRIPLTQIQNEYFLDVLQSLKVGEVSEVFASPLGLHIIKLNGIYDDTWPTLEKLALEYKKNKLYTEWINKLKKDIHISIKMTF
ncbi:MAG: peptidylprolyl isomerase [Candidatus Jordarchaeaceae archaeon]